MGIQGDEARDGALRRRLVDVPADGTAWFMRALRLRDAAPDAAAATVRRAVRCDPGDYRSWLNAGVLLRQLARPKRSRSYLRRASALAPECEPAWLTAGAVEEETGRSEEATACYVRAHRCDDRQPYAYRALARTRTLPEDVRPAAILRRCVADLDAVIAIQVGAAPGLTDDFLLETALADGRYRGILVEPHPAHARALDGIVAGNPRLSVVRRAVSDRLGVLTLYDLTGDTPPPKWLSGCSSTDRAHVERQLKRVPDGRFRIRCTEVPVTTPDSLCREFGIGRVDVLIVDTEGHDLTILRAFGPLLGKARFVMLEIQHLSAEARAEAESLIRTLGLDVVRVGDDLVGMRP